MDKGLIPIPQLGLSLVTTIGILALFLLTSKCEAISDHVRYWGQKDRLNRQQTIQNEDIAKLERQLQLSRSQSKKIYQQIQDLVKENQLQGKLSSHIAHLYLEKGHYDLAAQYYNTALTGKKLPPTSKQASSYLNFERSLSHFDSSLLLTSADKELFYKAGLAYANAARSQGWEPQRLAIAELLFKRMARIARQDVRPLYQLALLYGKTTVKTYRDRPQAISLLEKVLTKEDKHIPARFALAHFLVEETKLSQALAEYKKIQRILEDLKQKKVLKSPLNSYGNYQQAKKNQQKLEECIRSGEACLL